MKRDNFHLNTHDWLRAEYPCLEDRKGPSQDALDRKGCDIDPDTLETPYWLVETHDNHPSYEGYDRLLAVADGVVVCSCDGVL